MSANVELFGILHYLYLFKHYCGCFYLFYTLIE